MSEMIYWELGYVLSCILWGLFLMLIYDFLRIGRLVWKKGSIWVSVEDILYWSFAAIGTYRLFYQQDNGVIRWFAIAITFLVMFFMNHFISRRTVPFIGRILRIPVVFIGRILKKILRGIQKIVQRIQKMAGISWKRLKFLKKKVTMKKAKEEDTTQSRQKQDKKNKQNRKNKQNKQNHKNKNYKNNENDENNKNNENIQNIQNRKNNKNNEQKSRRNKKTKGTKQAKR